MIITEETVTYEYESKEERRNHVKEMEDKGYYVLKNQVTLDLLGFEHIIATFTIKRDGYRLHHINNGSIK